MKTIKEIAENPKITVIQQAKELIFGTFRFNNGKEASIIVGVNECGMDHVSVAPYSLHYTPSWDDMCQVKEACWGDDEEVYQIHPPRNEYVNISKNCLHLWARSDGKRLSEF